MSRREGGRVTLDGYSFVKGVRVSGTVPLRGTAKLRLEGDVAGTLSFSAGGRVTGRLGGRSIRARALLQRRTVTEIVTRRFGIPPLG
jgi:hypothetical protein